MSYDKEGDDLITACACARILHDVDGDVVRKMQAALARLCEGYGMRKNLCVGDDRQKFMNRLIRDIMAREAEINREVS